VATVVEKIAPVEMNAPARIASENIVQKSAAAFRIPIASARAAISGGIKAFDFRSHENPPL
jgi:hypothetical protein